MLILSITAIVVLTLVLLVLADEKSILKVPFLHRKHSIAGLFVRMAYKSDFITSTIRYVRRLGSLTISNICRLAK